MRNNGIFYLHSFFFRLHKWKERCEEHDASASHVVSINLAYQKSLFLCKVKSHRDEPLNETSDDLADLDRTINPEHGVGRYRFEARFQQGVFNLLPRHSLISQPFSNDFPPFPLSGKEVARPRIREWFQVWRCGRIDAETLGHIQSARCALQSRADTSVHHHY